MIDGPVIVDRDNMHGRFFGDRDDIYGRIVATAPLGSSVCSHVCFIRAVMSTSTSATDRGTSRDLFEKGLDTKRLSCLK